MHVAGSLGAGSGGENVHRYRVFIIYCVFFRILKIFRTLAFLCFPSASVCVYTRQVEHHRCSKTGRVQKNHKVLRKKHTL